MSITYRKGRMKNWFSSRKLKQKVRYLFLGIIATYLVLFFTIYNVFIKRNIMEYILNSNYKTMISIGNNLNSELNTINSMSRLLMADRDITSYLKVNAAPGSKYANNAMISIYDIADAFDYVNSIYLFRLNGEYIHIARGITEVDWLEINKDSWRQEIVDAKGGHIIRINGGNAFFRDTGDPLISLMRIANDTSTQKPIGMLVINLSYNILEDSFKDMEGTDKNFYYCDANLDPIKPGSEIDELKDIELTDMTFTQATISYFGDERILSAYRVPNTDLIIAGIEKMSYMTIIPSAAAWMIVSLIVITFFSLLLIGLFISMYITTPIERLAQSMDTAKKGWLKRVSLQLPDDEIGRLKDSYNNMLVAINQLIGELLDNEKMMQKAELDALQEQIKPHFLYNTLDTIAYLALQEASEKVYDAIETLGNFYRKFLSNGGKEITIRDEIGIVEDYLKLQKLRYEDVFEDEYDLDEDLLDIQVPKLILQPLVENSLYHGVRLKGEKGVIRISLFKKEDEIHLVVYDTGVGMSEEEISQIMVESDKNFGFKGTMERIRYYYGISNVFEIQSVEGQFTQIDLKIPVVRK